MSSPIPALNPPRSPDCAGAATAVIPLQRRAQPGPEADANAGRRPPSDDPADTGSEALDDPLVSMDGSGLGMLVAVHVPRRPMEQSTMWLLHASKAGSAEGRSADLAPDQGAAYRPSALAFAAMPMPGAQANSRAASTPSLAGGALPTLDGSLDASHQGPLGRPLAILSGSPDSDVVATHSHPLPGTGPSGPSPSRQHGSAEGRGVPLTDPEPGMRGAGAGDSPGSPDAEPRRRVLDTASVPLHTAGNPQPRSTAPAHAAEVRRHDSSAAALKPGPTFDGLPDGLPTQRVTRVSVPFARWGPGHQVTASWVPVAAGDPPGSITLRGSSESARRAIVSALADRDLAAAGGLQLAAADSTDDGTSGHRRAHHVPEDDE